MPDEPSKNGDLLLKLEPSSIPSSTVPLEQNIELQDYINKMVESRLGTILEKIQSSQIQSPLQSQTSEDPYQKLAEELAKEQEVDIKVAKGFVDRMSKISELKNRELNDRLTNFELAAKFSQVFKEHEDAGNLQNKMTLVFQGLNSLEKSFVMNSPDGAEYLYNKTKKEAEKFSIPISDKLKGGSGGGQSLSTDKKLGSQNVLLQEASTLLTKGDRVAYEEKMRQINRG